MNIFEPEFRVGSGYIENTALYTVHYWSSEVNFEKSMVVERKGSKPPTQNSIVYFLEGFLLQKTEYQIKQAKNHYSPGFAVLSL